MDPQPASVRATPLVIRNLRAATFLGASLLLLSSLLWPPFAAYATGLNALILALYFLGVLTFIDPSTFVIHESFIILGMVVFGGMGTIVGPIAGAITMVLIPEGLRFVGLPSFYAAHLRQVLFSVLIILILLKRPQGLCGKEIE